MWQIRLISKEIYIMKLKVESVRSEFYSVSYENNNDNAMFYFDLTNYTLIVVSNRGNFIGKWHNNDDKSFLELICDTDKSQFLSHIAVKDTYNKVVTWENIKKYLFDTLDGKTPDFSLADIEDACYDYLTESTLCSEIYGILRCSHFYFLDSAAEENIAMAIESDYNVEAYMIANVFDEQIKPYIKLCIEKTSDSTNDWLDKEIEVDGITCSAIVCPHCMTFFNSSMIYGNYCPQCGARMIHTTK
jgi:hypothetical protein